MTKKSHCPSPTQLNGQIRHWLESPLGEELQAQESACLTRLLEARFGYYLLQIGLPTLQPRTSGSGHIQTRVNILTEGAEKQFEKGVLADPLQLPVASDSIDLVLMTHALDFSRNPHQLLREAERVLIPEGHLIICGFNPWSLWGLRHGLPMGRKRVPWCGHFLSQGRLNDWLSLLGFDVQKNEMLMFRPPIPHKGVLRRLHFMESVGQRLWPFFAGVYVTQAIKRVSTLTPIKPAWKLRPRRIRGQVVEPTARSIK